MAKPSPWASTQKILKKVIALRKKDEQERMERGLILEHTCRRWAWSSPPLTKRPDPTISKACRAKVCSGFAITTCDKTKIESVRSESERSRNALVDIRCLPIPRRHFFMSQQPSDRDPAPAIRTGKRPKSQMLRPKRRDEGRTAIQRAIEQSHNQAGKQQASGIMPRPAAGRCC